MDDGNAGKPPDKRQLEISESSTWEAESTSLMSSVTNREDTESKQTKRAKILVWTSELHKRFVDAVDQLGLMNATPEGIMKLMDVGGLLSYYDVETHLQAYKFSLQTMEDASAATPPAVGPVVDDFLMQREEMHLTGVEIPNAHQVFDKISRRPGASESITFSSSPSQATASLSDPYHLFDYPWVLDYAPFCDVGETGAKFASLVKFVVNVKRWKKRVSARLLMPQLILDMNVGSGVPVCAPPSTMTYGKAKKVQLAWEVEAKLASLMKFVVNIMRWKTRATARLNLDNEVRKRVLDSGAFTTTSQKATRTSSRFKSLLKFVVIIIRWKNRALARQQRALIPLHGNQLGLQLVSRDFFIMSRQLQVLDLRFLYTERCILKSTMSWSCSFEVAKGAICGYLVPSYSR